MKWVHLFGGELDLVKRNFLKRANFFTFSAISDHEVFLSEFPNFAVTQSPLMEYSLAGFITQDLRALMLLTAY